MRPHPTLRLLSAALALLIVFASIPGCKKKPAQIPSEISASDEALYKLGEAEIKKNQEKAILYLRQLIDSFPKSFYAQRAKLLIADSYFKKGDEGNMILAAAEYREFIKAYPYSPSASYCQYQIALTFYKKIEKPGRDQTKTSQALDEFKKVIADYPASDQAKPAQEKIKECEERLATHYAGIGIQYAKMKIYKAAVSRLTEVMTTYPDYSRMDSVYYYIGESYVTMAPEQARPYYTKLVTDFPKSPYVKKSTKRLKEISERLKTVPAAKPVR
jgi:outer membrane protein assembly factor BamD